MKKVFLSAVIVSALFACGTKTENNATTPPPAATNVPAEAFGYTLNSSENINTAKKAINAGANLDTTTFKSIYADTAVIYDNMNKQTIFDNMKMGSTFKSKGITLKIEKIGDIWETISFKEDDRSFKNYVNVYFDASFIKGTQKSTVRINAVFAFKDGKIVREWDTYDSAPVVEMFK
jgi:hypothetical protein